MVVSAVVAKHVRLYMNANTLGNYYSPVPIDIRLACQHQLIAVVAILLNT